jgi:hypothetical protein
MAWLLHKYWNLLKGWKRIIYIHLKLLLRMFSAYEYFIFHDPLPRISSLVSSVRHCLQSHRGMKVLKEISVDKLEYISLLLLKNDTIWTPKVVNVSLIRGVGKGWNFIIPFVRKQWILYIIQSVSVELRPYRGLAVTSRDDVIDGRPPYWRYFFRAARTF